MISLQRGGVAMLTRKIVDLVQNNATELSKAIVKQILNLNPERIVWDQRFRVILRLNF